MAIENRDLGTAQQRESYQVLVGQGASSLIATGTTAAVCLVPFPAQLATANMVGFGLSGNPTVTFDVTRYNSAGVTTITGIVSTLTVQSATLSQLNGFTVSSGASLVPLQTGDVLHFRTATANTAMVTATVTLALQALQDVKTHFNH
jgi:hypothetical protein